MDSSCHHHQYLEIYRRASEPLSCCQWGTPFRPYPNSSASCYCKSRKVAGHRHNIHACPLAWRVEVRRDPVLSVSVLSGLFTNVGCRQKSHDPYYRLISSSKRQWRLYAPIKSSSVSVCAESSLALIEESPLPTIASKIPDSIAIRMQKNSKG